MRNRYAPDSTLVVKNHQFLRTMRGCALNHPLSFQSLYVPSFKAYYHQRLPKSLHVLTPACTGFDVQRTDDRTLVIQSRGSNFFSCDDVGPVHVANALNAFDRLLSVNFKYKKGVREELTGLTVEVLETDASDIPSKVAFHFDHSLDSPDFLWFWFDWRSRAAEKFKIPAIGQNVTISGPTK